MLKRLPKFHDRKSLLLGIIAGMFLVFSGMFHNILAVGIMQMLVGFGLTLHCYDTYRLYRKRRIVRIVKTDTERIVHKEDARKDKSMD